MKRLTLDLEDDLHRRFKLLSVDRDIAMVEILRQLLEAWVAKEESQDGRATGRGDRPVTVERIKAPPGPAERRTPGS